MSWNLDHVRPGPCGYIASGDMMNVGSVNLQIYIGLVCHEKNPEREYCACVLGAACVR